MGLLRRVRAARGAEKELRAVQTLPLENRHEVRTEHALNSKPLAVVTPRTKVRLRRDKFHWSGGRIPCWKLRAAVAEEAAVRLLENARRFPGEGAVTNFGAAADRFAGVAR